MYSFRNDYSEGAHPKVLQALADTNLRQTVRLRHGPHAAKPRRMTIRRLCAAPDADGSLPGGRDAGEPRHHRRVSAVL